MDTFQLSILTPERSVFDAEVEEAILPGVDGYLGVLPGHAPLLAAMKPGEIFYRQQGAAYSLATRGGFVEVLPDRVITLTEATERPEEIDVDRARDSKARAEKLLKDFEGPPEELEHQRRRLERAEVRLKIALRNLSE